MDWASFAWGGVLMGSAGFLFGALWAGRDDDGDYARGWDDGLAYGRQSRRTNDAAADATAAREPAEATVQIVKPARSNGAASGLGGDGSAVVWPQSASRTGHVMPFNDDAAR